MRLDTIIWLFAAAGFACLEAATTALISFWFSVGAVAALLCCCLTDNITIQTLVFAVVSCLCLAFMIPKLYHSKRNKEISLNGAAHSLGRQGIVLHSILPGDVGRVHVDGLDWKAKAGTTIPAGTRVRVDGAEGAVLIVSQLEDCTKDTAHQGG